MARSIKITDEIRNEALKNFYNALVKLRMSDGKISFSRDLGVKEAKAELVFTSKAWEKMQALIREFDTEVGWHGTAERADEDGKNIYRVTDIIVYPQSVTGATVTTDDKEIDEWARGIDDDTYNAIKFQGHSHVNMAVSPSGTDLQLYDKFLSDIADDSFYIFVIWNKKGEKTVKIYDMAKNTLFETADVEVLVEEDDDSLSAFISNAKEIVKHKPAATTSVPQTAYASSYSGKYGGHYGWDDDDYGWSPYYQEYIRQKAESESDQNKKKYHRKDDKK